MRWPQFCGPYDRSKAIKASGATLLNWYVQPLPKSAAADYALYPAPGTRTWASFTGDVGGRALYQINGQAFGVIGPGVYEFFAGRTGTRYGDVAQNGNLAYMTSNGQAGGQLLIASGTNGYVLDLASHAITPVLTAEATQIGMLDGYFIAFHNGRIRLSDLNDGLTWDPTQFAQRGAAPDNWKAMLVNPPDIWLVGEQTGDIWYDAGSFPFPLAARGGLTYKFGIAAVHSLAAAGSSVLWLSRNTDGDGIVVRSRGYTPQRTSTPEIEAEIASYARQTTIDDAEGWTYQQVGRWFYVLRFPAYATWVLDLDTNMWHRRSTFDVPSATDLPWRVRVHCQAFGKHLVGITTSGVVCELDTTVGQEYDGTPIVRQRIAPMLFQENTRARIKKIELFAESGVGLPAGQGSDPILMLSQSDDAGMTWGSEKQLHAGKLGEYPKRMVARRLGRSRNRVIKVRGSDPIPWRIIDAFANHE